MAHTRLSPPAVTDAELDAWCLRWLGSGVAETLFSSAHLSAVVGVRLKDDREVVVKVRPPAARLAVCAAVQEALWHAGFCCPRPLLGPVAFGAYAASAEVLLPGGEPLGVEGVAEYARLLAELIRLAPPTRVGGAFAPHPPWTAWDHEHAGVWPPPDDRDADLNTVRSTMWLDHVAGRVRERLRRVEPARIVIGHGDWGGHNLRWRDGRPWAAHDWDSVVSAPEAVIVGFASAEWPSAVTSRAATVAESEAFLEAYQQAAGRRFSADEQQAAWAAGLWTHAFNTKKAALDGAGWMAPREAEERLHRAAA